MQSKARGSGGGVRRRRIVRAVNIGRGGIGLWLKALHQGHALTKVPSPGARFSDRGGPTSWRVSTARIIRHEMSVVRSWLWFVGNPVGTRARSSLRNPTNRQVIPHMRHQLQFGADRKQDLHQAGPGSAALVRSGGKARLRRFEPGIRTGRSVDLRLREGHPWRCPRHPIR